MRTNRILSEAAIVGRRHRATLGRDVALKFLALAALGCSPSSEAPPTLRGAYELSRWSDASVYRALTFGPDGRYTAHLAACRIECREVGTYTYAGQIAELKSSGGTTRRLTLSAQTKPASLQVSALSPAADSLVGGQEPFIDGQNTLLGFDARTLRASGAGSGVDVGSFSGLAGKKYCGTNA